MDWTKLRLSSLNTVDLPTFDATPSDPFVFKGAEGLGAVDRTVSISKAYNQASILQSIQPQNRVVVIRIGLNPSWDTGQTASELREMLYAMLTGGYANAPVTLSVMDGEDVLCLVDGHVEKLEPLMFTKDPEVQLTLSCLSPYFRAPEATFPVLSGLDKTVPEIMNTGTAPSGFDFQIEFTAALTYWQIENEREDLRMRVEHNFVIGDQLRLITIVGGKAVQLVHGGDVSSLLKGLTVESGWHQLYPGLNRFYTSSASFNWVDFSYTAQYQGV